MSNDSNVLETQNSHQDRACTEAPTTKVSPKEHKKGVIDLLEIRPGLYINVYQIVSVRVLAQKEENIYAELQLSNGDKLTITREEFTTISGQPCRYQGRISQNSMKDYYGGDC